VRIALVCLALAAALECSLADGARAATNRASKEIVSGASGNVSLGWVPRGCRHPGALSLEAEDPERSAEARWNEHYLAAIEALETEDLDFAHLHFCAALSAARAFGPRDWRFAETLDELGLVAYLSSDFELAETMQGAAVAEMLFALGPDAVEVGSAYPGRRGRLSSVTIYAARLNMLYGLLGRDDLAAETERTPYRVLERGYIPLDAATAGRLDWLISQYLLAEHFAAAEWLSDLRSEILSRR